MKRILVVYYTQTGQLRQIIDSMLKPLVSQGVFSIDYEQLTPIPEYPFPWRDSFFECFPESVMGVSCPLKPFTHHAHTSYDLVILAYQSWFLSPSIPMHSFLKTPHAKQLLKGKKVITLLGIRNMWVSAQEIIKKQLFELGAELTGNIVLADRNNNWIAGITIIKWLVYGNRGPSFLLPRSGVSEKEIDDSQRFGEIIGEAVMNDDYNALQQKLVSKGAVEVKFDLMLIEKNARKIFVKFAHNILQKGKDRPRRRASGITIFKYYLLFALFLLSPIISVIFTIIGWVLYPMAVKQTRYYKGITIK